MLAKNGDACLSVKVVDALHWWNDGMEWSWQLNEEDAYKKNLQTSLNTFLQHFQVFSTK